MEPHILKFRLGAALDTCIMLNPQGMSAYAELFEEMAVSLDLAIDKLQEMRVDNPA